MRKIGPGSTKHKPLPANYLLFILKALLVTLDLQMKTFGLCSDENMTSVLLISLWAEMTLAS